MNRTHRLRHGAQTVLALVALVALLGGCRTPEERYCDALIARAQDEEPQVTTRLKSIAAAAGGELIKLEYRLKGRDSMLRKVNKARYEHPQTGLAEVRIDDALRYTMQVDDTPAGNYLTTARRTLAEFETLGHTVVLVKNYWPSGDSYSGLNCVLRAPSGLHWELQFHTGRSIAVNAGNRKAYEELRLVSTEDVRKRQLFDQMTDQWDDVPIPADVLKAGAVHPASEIITRPRP